MNKISPYKKMMLLTVAIMQSINHVNIHARAEQSFSTKNKLPKIYNLLTVDSMFGGTKSSGVYNRTTKTVSISNQDTHYDFDQIIEDRNPRLSETKRTVENIVPIGSFIAFYAKGMPVTKYLHGLLIHQESSLSQRNENDTNAALGSDPSTYAPIPFTPSEKFQGQGVVGNYFPSTGIATIHDPSGQNHQTYNFSEVQAGKPSNQDTPLVLVGSYITTPTCTNGICSHAVMKVALYGKLEQEDSMEQA